MVKHTQTIRLLWPTNCLNMVDHFVGLALKELMFMNNEIVKQIPANIGSMALLGAVILCIVFRKT